MFLIIGISTEIKRWNLILTLDKLCYTVVLFLLKMNFGFPFDKIYTFYFWKKIWVSENILWCLTIIDFYNNICIKISCSNLVRFLTVTVLCVDSLMQNFEDFQSQKMKLVDMRTSKSLWRNFTGCQMYLSSSHTLTLEMGIFSPSIMTIT